METSPRGPATGVAAGTFAGVSAGVSAGVTSDVTGAPGRDRPRSRARWVLAALWTAALAVVVLPDLVGLDQRIPFAQLVAFRPWIAAGAAVLALLLAVLTAFRRGAWPLLAGTVAVVLVAAAMVLPRAVPAAVPGAGRPLTIAVANVYLGEADPAALAALVRDHRPDVVALPEAAGRFGARIEPLVAPLGYRLHVSVPDGTPDVDGVSALVSDRLGDVVVRVGTEPGPDPYLEITGGALGDVRVVTYHAAAPTPGRMAAWRADLGSLSRWCAGPGRTVIAGDLNATLDHSGLRAGAAGCSDAAAQRGAGLEPTWSPSERSRSFGPQIDHVLTTPGIDAATFDVYDLPGSDHRAVFTTLWVT